MKRTIPWVINVKEGIQYVFWQKDFGGGRPWSFVRSVSVDEMDKEIPDFGSIKEVVNLSTMVEPQDETCPRPNGRRNSSELESYQEVLVDYSYLDIPYPW